MSLLRTATATTGMQKAKLKAIGWMLIVASIILAATWQALQLAWFLLRLMF